MQQSGKRALLSEEHQRRLLELRGLLVARMGTHRANHRALTSEDNRPATDRSAPVDGLAAVISGCEKNDARCLEQINAALKRLDQGTYGICEICDDQISQARLEAQPIATKCTACKEREEDENAQASSAKSKLSRERSTAVRA